jgi:hypothetical protein
MSFGAEIDDVLNHPNDASPVGVLTSPDFGKVLSLNSTLIGSPNANRMIYISTPNLSRRACQNAMALPARSAKVDGRICLTEKHVAYRDNLRAQNHYHQ